MIACALTLGFLAAATTPAATTPAATTPAATTPTAATPAATTPAATTPAATPSATTPAATTVPSPPEHATLFRGAHQRWRWGRLVGAGATALGVVLLGVAAGFGVRTLSLESDRKKLCPAQLCLEPSAFQFYEQARASQNTGVVLAVAGGALAAAGVALFALDLGGEPLHVTPAAGVAGVALTLQGTF